MTILKHAVKGVHYRWALSFEYVDERTRRPVIYAVKPWFASQRQAIEWCCQLLGVDWWPHCVARGAAITRVAV